jgi:sugar lactone lactonase YvrE
LRIGHVSPTPPLTPDQLTFVGRDLKRPECVLCMPSGRLYVADRAGGILRIEPDGRQSLLAWKPPAGVKDFIPNGFALLPDGTFLVANMGHDGGVWARRPGGQVAPYLMEVDGERLAKANFVFNDEAGRVWITVTTRSDPLAKAMTALGAPECNDGFVCLVDGDVGKGLGARIVADGFAFTNEARIDASGERLYVVETQGRRITRFRLGPDGALSGRETFASFGHGTFADGIAFDAEGHLWVTSIVSNRLFRIAPDGTIALVFEDGRPDHVDRIERAMADGSISRDLMYLKSGRQVHNIASIAFGGPDLRTAYLGSLVGDTLASFHAPVAGLPLPHWRYGDGSVGS